MEHPSLPPSEFDRPPPPNKGEGLVLCLSGGGFRATFFHLGVVRYLAAIDALRHVDDIYAVSGGSILAAHLAQRWDDYKDQKTFNAAADELREFADWDVRGRIVRKWLLGMCVGLPLYLSRFRREQLLIDEYRKFFGQKQRSTDLAVLKPRFGPGVHLLTTSLTTGQLCEFTADGLIPMDPSRSKIESARFNLPLAVAASSAFPALFPPVTINARRFRIPREAFRVDTDQLTDGGVYDNLGIRAAMKQFLSSGALYGTDVLVSDASASFDWKTRSSFWSLVGLTGRSIDIQMKRIAELEIESQITRVALAKLAIMNALVAGTEPGQCQSARVPRIRVVRINGGKEDSRTINPRFEMKTGGFEGTFGKLVGLSVEGMMPWHKWAIAMSSIRTDLDRFSKEELQALEKWGYERARSCWPTSAPIRPEEPPTDEQLIKLERSARRKLRIVTVRGFFGAVALLVALTVLARWLWARSASSLWPS